MHTRTEDWSIQEIARIANTTSRTLRHYDEVGLVRPTRVGDNGYRYYDRTALVRLQRVLMLREMGLGIPAIAEMLTDQADDVVALESHLLWLKESQNRIARQMASVRRTIDQLTGKEQIMAQDMPHAMFDGFDHTVFREEVEQRWGTEAYDRGDSWWNSKTDAEKAEWKAAQAALQSDWAAAAERGDDPAGAAAQAMAQRQFDALAGVPGTPGYRTGGPTKAYFIGLGEMYVEDPRFAAHYGGADNAAFVRDAMRAYAERELS
ncbi:MAG TPA: MerR family transcriptional regulator [Pseudolysinimonas sp.]|jgi:DNA-binding transcriptional MerR regulator